MQGVRFPALAALVAVLLLLPSASASAHTCADYPNQAAAQRAHDTVDGDGDGIYCEALPCPCSRAKGGGGSGGSTPGRRPPRLGRPVLLGPWSRKEGCTRRHNLPDPGCTPGTYYPKATKRVICRPGYAASVRNVPESRRLRVYRSYGRAVPYDGRNGELDHLVSLELGGSNSIANLFPQPAGGRWGSAAKDRLENAVHAEVCAGRMRLRAAQRAIARDWVALYREVLG